MNSTEIIDTDIVVIGAGSAGSTLAARLSEDGKTRVTVVEAGGKDSSPWIHIPIGYGKTITDARLNWRYETEPDTEIANRRMFWARGRVLGGSSSINGLLYIRGQAQDYDTWAQMGNPGWSYAEVLPYFRKAECFENGADAYHGGDGPLKVSNLIERNPICTAFIQSGVDAGIPYNDDFNGAAQEGIGFYHTTTHKARRCSAARAYLHPAKKRPNLRVITNALAERLTFDGKRATGVVLLQKGRKITIRAKREVILASGSIGSPKLLLQSGIGPAEDLRALGIAPVHHLPGVGHNLQDHYGAILNYRSRLPLTVNDIMLSKWRQLKAGLQYVMQRKGPLTISAAQVGAFVRTRPDLEQPDAQFLFQTFSHDEYDAGLHPFSGFANVVCPVRPQSRGQLRLRSAQAQDAPIMQANYLSSEYDRRVLIDGVKLARKVASQGPVTAHIVEEFAPGGGVVSDDEILAYCRETGLSIAHQVGTCKMGQDAMAVVDSSLRVHGLQGLRVVDASIMPNLISGNTNAPTIMIAEKAADMIRAAA